MRERSQSHLNELVQLDGSRSIDIGREEYSLEGAGRKMDSMIEKLSPHLPNLIECILQLLKVNRSALISVKEVEGILHISIEANPYFPLPYFVEKRLELLNSELTTVR